MADTIFTPTCDRTENPGVTGSIPVLATTFCFRILVDTGGLARFLAWSSVAVCDGPWKALAGHIAEFWPKGSRLAKGRPGRRPPTRLNRATCPLMGRRRSRSGPSGERVGGRQAGALPSLRLLPSPVPQGVTPFTRRTPSQRRAWPRLGVPRPRSRQHRTRDGTDAAA